MKTIPETADEVFCFIFGHNYSEYGECFNCGKKK